MVNEIIEFLKSISTDEGYYIKDFSSNIYFGVDSGNNYIFARINNSNDSKFSMKTKTITVYQNYDFEFKTENDLIKDKFDVLILNYNYHSTLETFINLCLNFYDKDDGRTILELTEDLIQLYKVIGSGDYISQQGFWSELFTIDYLYEKFDINIAKYWHTDPFNKYDFSIKSDFKIEVKSTIKEYREHEFSHEQIFTNNNVIVSSVMMKKDDSGVTIKDLFARIERLFKDNYEIFKMLEVEMSKFLEDNLLKFNYDYAEENIKFYSNKDIPKFEIPEPNGVHGTRYLAQLEMIEPLSEENIYSLNSVV
nr:PD-(D/E)XK motif protein [Bacilli bacterium]